MRDLIGPWVGVLGMAFDPSGGGWVLGLRCEQVETVRWGGKPEKQLKAGPMGHRLTPRGSFEEWLETVRGEAEPWAPGVLQAARETLSELQQAVLARHGEMERARNQMLAMLGHDLRDPLHSISMAAQVLERTTAADGPQRIGARIRSSSGRMQRLVGEVLDLSRLRSGLGLGIKPAEIDLAFMLRDLCDEARLAHPGVDLQVDAPDTLSASIDADRLAQVISNLLGNARHHGEPGHPVRVRLVREDDGSTVLSVHNHAAPIPADRADKLFQPFKGSADGNPNGHRGLGLGLYIAHEIVVGHGGRLRYRHEAPEVVFEAWLPAPTDARPSGQDATG
jgi:light-regulated signal transduction histidine kinase (bacteriophytochrome)